MLHDNWSFDGNAVIATDGAVIKWDDNTFFTINFNGNTFNGEVIKEDIENNNLELKIGHRVFKISKKGELDALIAELGMDAPKVRKLKELQAPMPGRILSIAVEIGQEINVGDDILSLEAMKMENILKAEGTGIVKAILVNAGDVVEKGAIIIDFE